MIGGRVVAVEPWDAGLYITAQDEHGQRLAVGTREHAGVVVGDTIWWQNNRIMWCRPGQFRDRPLSRRGYSHNPARRGASSEDRRPASPEHEEMK